MNALSDRVISVVTLNIQNRVDPWDERLAVIRRGLQRLQPDVVALQEVFRLPEYDFDQSAQIAEGLGYHLAHAEVAGGEYALGNAVLSRWPIARTERYRLPHGDADDERRCAILTKLETPWGALPFVNTHLNWKLHHGHIRCEQVRGIARAIEAFVETGDLPCVLAGDFNAERESDEVRFLRGHTGLGGSCVYFNDCFASAGRGDGATFSRRNPMAAPSREADRGIDYVFVCGPDERLRGVPLESAVCFDEPEDGVWASDHFGVWARIEL